jgi:8-oxo-dGTP pyrophosphatase MutT (NUDIX family)
MTLDRRRRHTARVLLVDRAGRVLLLRGGDPGRPAAGTWWFTLGGGIEAGESVEEAASRELLEETGLSAVDVGPVVLEREIEHEFDGVIYDQRETYFLVRVDPFVLDTSQWSAIEVATVAEYRWWSREKLRSTTERVFPSGLAELLDRLDGPA